jgi:hypothetical protein
MSLRVAALSLLVFLFSSLATAKDKNKSVLPEDVLRARTVLVMVNPEAETSLEHPNDNRNAVRDVEEAIMRWGRFSLVMEATTADLIIMVQANNGKLVSPTIEGGSVDHRPVIIDSAGDANIQSTRIGVQRGNPIGDRNDDPMPNTGAHPGARVGTTDQMFMVYRGRSGYVAAGPDDIPVWRYNGKGGLHSPDVPAVGEFRKVVEEAEKQAQKKTKPTP